MTKTPFEPLRAQRACGAPHAPAHRLSLATPQRPIRLLLLLVLALSAAALLAGCTRDRPIEDLPTPAPAAIGTPAASAAPAAAASQPETATNSIGEPQVEVSKTVSGTAAGGTPDPNAVTIEEYEVTSGDTLASIASQFDVSIAELRSLNALTADLIQIGQRLSVPVKPAEPTPTPEPFYHIVAAGESLSGIAAQYGVPMPDIVKANVMPDPNALRAGMKILIPGYSPNVAEATDGAASADSAAASVSPDQQATHVVKAGQTATQIALMYDLTLGELQRANNIANISNLRTGQVLILPGLTVQQAQAALSTTHTVSAGESLSGIAKQYGIPMAEIMRANSISNANLIKPGQVLIIPPPSN